MVRELPWGRWKPEVLAGKLPFVVSTPGCSGMVQLFVIFIRRSPLEAVAAVDASEKRSRMSGGYRTDAMIEDLYSVIRKEREFICSCSNWLVRRKEVVNHCPREGNEAFI